MFEEHKVGRAILLNHISPVVTTKIKIEMGPLYPGGLSIRKTFDGVRLDIWYEKVVFSVSISGVHAFHVFLHGLVPGINAPPCAVSHDWLSLL
jgi:hypothetical protein